MPFFDKNLLRDYYAHETPGVLTNMLRLLNHGTLKNTGQLMILAVDQGFEHGPVRSFHMNPEAYDPLYHWHLATAGGFSGFAAPKGLLEAGVCKHLNEVPLILKMNSSHGLGPASQHKNLCNQAMTATLDDALRLGCVGIGFTIYPGSDFALDLYEELKDTITEARHKGLFTVIWSYPRGNMISTAERALDVVSYGVHTACLLGAHIVKTKIPSDHVDSADAKTLYQDSGIPFHDTTARIKHVVQSAFNGRRLVIFSGGETKDEQELLNDVKAIRQGGGHGVIVGRNYFQRPQKQALDLIQATAMLLGGKN